MPRIIIEEANEYSRRLSKTRRDEWFKENGPCVSCGSNSNLELDHIDPTTKDEQIKISHNIWYWRKSRRIKELAKCQVLCKICHEKKTIIQLTKPITHNTIAGYTKGCRCKLCMKAKRLYMRKYMRKYRH